MIIAMTATAATAIPMIIPAPPGQVAVISIVAPSYVTDSVLPQSAFAIQFLVSMTTPARLPLILAQVSRVGSTVWLVQSELLVHAGAPIFFVLVNNYNYLFLIQYKCSRF